MTASTSPETECLSGPQDTGMCRQFASLTFLTLPEIARPGGANLIKNCSVDVLSEYGELLVKIQTDFYVQNIQFAGLDLDELWIFGISTISRVRWALKGQSGKALS